MALLLFAFASPPTLAQDAAKFYEGKQVRLLIGADPAGPYDAYGRLLGRHLSKHIPGQPRVVVQNMPGAISVIAANYAYNIAPQDGTVLLNLMNLIPLARAFGEVNIQFDPARFQWIGNMAREHYTVAVRADSAVKSIEDATRIPIKMGATSNSAMNSIYPRLINSVAGTKFELVSGYRGLAGIETAMQRGEVDGFAGDSVFKGHGQGPSYNWYRDGTARMIALIGSTRPPEFPDVPLLVDLAKDAETRQLLALFSSPADVGKPVVLGPDVPLDRVAAMRAAFQATMADPEFLADAGKMNLAIDPMPGEELTMLVRRLMAVPDSVAQRAREAIKR